METMGGRRDNRHMLFRHPFQNLFFLVVCVVVVVAAYLRVEHISEIYDEYDDVGVIALQKAPLQELELDLDLGPIKRIRFDVTYLQNIETSIWYGAFIGHVGPMRQAVYSGVVIAVR